LELAEWEQAGGNGNSPARTQAKTATFQAIAPPRAPAMIKRDLLRLEVEINSLERRIDEIDRLLGRTERASR
jgi:hypothetical protein